MPNTLETSFGAFSHWLKEQGLDPKDFALAIRAKDELSRSKLNCAIERWSEGLQLFTPTNVVTLKQNASFKYRDLQISISSLDAGAPR